MRRGAFAAILALLMTPPAHAQVVSELGIGAQFQRSGGVGAGGPLFQAGLRVPIADRLAARVGAHYAAQARGYAGYGVATRSGCRDVG